MSAPSPLLSASAPADPNTTCPVCENATVFWGRPTKGYACGHAGKPAGDPAPLAAAPAVNPQEENPHVGLVAIPEGALAIRLTCGVCGRDTEPALEATHVRKDGETWSVAFIVLNADARCWYCGSARGTDAVTGNPL